MWSNEILAYFAGLFDGEGHLSIEKQRPNGTQRKKDYYTLRLVIVNTNFTVIDWCVFHFKGSFTLNKKIEGHKQVYKFVLFGSKLFDVLIACYPYIIIKKPIIDIAFKFRETVGKTGWHVSDETLAIRKDLWAQAKIINKPGDHK
jgi:hypothetical protein